MLNCGVPSCPKLTVKVPSSLIVSVTPATGPSVPFHVPMKRLADEPLPEEAEFEDDELDDELLVEDDDELLLEDIEDLLLVEVVEEVLVVVLAPELLLLLL